MEILLISIKHYDNFNGNGIYSDLIRLFQVNNHKIFVLCPFDGTKNNQQLVVNNDITFGYIPIGRTKGSKNIIKKGLELFLSEYLFKRYYKKYYNNESFDLILYATPPISFQKVIGYAKKKSGAKSYLMLKDIFPQNAIDLGLLSKKGIKGILTHMFRKKENRLYQVSDYIGCMSEANIAYLKNHNPNIDSNKIEVLPNCVDVIDKRINKNEKILIREKYNLPKEKTILVYGGNLGRPQGIPFMLEAIKATSILDDVFYLVIGFGSEFDKISNFINEKQLSNIRLIKNMPQSEYEMVVSACDIGLIFLDHRFTIPNFPSRILDYMRSGLPVFACVDNATDVGLVGINGHFGWSCYSNDIDGYVSLLRSVLKCDLLEYGENSYQYFVNNYSTQVAYNTIIRHYE